MGRDGNRRASDAQRADAVRRMELHLAMGHLDEDEADGRIEKVEASRTPNEIAAVFADLPALPARSRSTEARISNEARARAIDRLRKACQEGRLDPDEYAAAKATVEAARTRNEVHAAFHGLPTPRRAATEEAASRMARQTAHATTRVVAEGGRRAGRAFRRAVLAVGALLIGGILLIAGIGTAALICFLGAAVLFVAAATSLVPSRSSG